MPIFKADAVSKKASLLKIFYFRDTDDARASLFKHPGSIDVLAPQAYSIDDAGKLSGAVDQEILNFTQANNIVVMPLVTNKGFSKDIADSILDDEGKQNTTIYTLITEAQKQKYWGWQIDFEGMDASYKDKYSAFIKKTYLEFKKHNLIFSVAVVAQVSSDPTDYPKDLWNRVIGVYDYSALAISSDFVSIMSYDNPKSKGPIAPYPWLEKVVKYSLKYIPADKLSLGIPLYYWKWDDATGKLLEIGGYAGIQNTLKRKGIYLGYSTLSEAPYIKYKVNKKHYTLWYENKKSIAKKISLIKKYKLQGFSAWVLGLETPNIYSAF